MTLSRTNKEKIFSISPRILADVLLINLAFSLAYAVRIVSGIISIDDPLVESNFINFSSNMYGVNAPLITGVTLLSYMIFGCYNKARFYRDKYKLLAVLQATGVAALSYTTVGYFLNRTMLLPRSVTIITFISIFIFCGGGRLLKWNLEKRFELRPRMLSKKNGKVEKVLVVGGAGYIGSILCRQLLDKGYKVRCLDILMFGDNSIKALYDNPDFEFMKGDFRHVETVVKGVRDVNAVIHLGAIVGDPACAIDEDYSIDVNYAATCMIREVCRGFGVRRFIFASTCSVYGANDEISNEKSRLNPVSLYAQTKIDSEQAILALHDDGFSPTVLRLSTVFGYSPRPRFDLVINIVTAMAVLENSCKIFGGTQWRPFIHVADVAKAMVAVIEASEEVVSGEIFNVGDDKMNMMLSEVGDLIEKQFPEATVERIEEDVDRRNYKVSFKKIRSQLDFTCDRTIELGINEILTAIQNGEIDNYTDIKFNNLNYLKRLRKTGDSAAYVVTEETKTERLISA
jgi:nucleoside-diphosphate-sugar epimerase